MTRLAGSRAHIHKASNACPTLVHPSTSPEHRYMPINLKGVLAAYGISQSAWAGSITQAGGRGRGRALSISAATQILNWGVWPSLTPAETIKAQTESLLREHDVPRSVIKTIWEEDVHNQHRNKHPKGCHVGQRSQQLYQSEVEPMEVEMLSAAAKKQFHIFKDPFIDDVQSAEDIFLSAEQRYIRESMYTTAKHGGFLAVIGESGSGKTTLRRDLLDRIQREGLPITVIMPRIIDKTRLTAGSICEAIIRDISQQRPRQSLEAKARQVEEILTGSSRAGNSHVLMIEEAHDLTVQTLKYLKRFWELEDGFKKLLSIILIGQPELKNKLDERQNYEAREVIRRCEIAELLPLNGNLKDYMALKFKRIGKDPRELFESDAYDAIRERLTVRKRGSDGVISLLYPLVVNNLITKAFNLGAEIGAKKINAEIIKEI